MAGLAHALLCSQHDFCIRADGAPFSLASPGDTVVDERLACNELNHARTRFSLHSTSRCNTKPGSRQVRPGRTPRRSAQHPSNDPDTSVK